MSVTPNFCCDETKNGGAYTRLTGGKGTGQSGTQGLLSTGTPHRSVESFHKSALPPGGHIRALVWGEEDLRCVCLSAGALGNPIVERQGENPRHQSSNWALECLRNTFFQYHYEIFGWHKLKIYSEKSIQFTT